jgi:hypothetical protein
MAWNSKILLLAAVAFCAQGAEKMVNGRRSAVMEGKAAQLTIDLAGGSIVDFHLTGGVNPFRWESPGGATEARPMGHFLCLDRWGAPSDAEKNNGMWFHGEAPRVEWTVQTDSASRNGLLVTEMSATLPMAGIEARRRVRMAEDGTWFHVTETATNRNKLGRIYNMVQHPTIGPPFLDEGTLVDSNARQGFMQSSPLPNPEVPAVVWPQALKDGQAVNLRHLTDDPMPNVVSYVIDDEYGWTTAASPSAGLLLGYVWKTADYPWFNAWRHVENGKPKARGLEFGTTGLHQPYPVLVKKGRIFGRPLFAYLDAGETQSRAYGCFLVRIPKDYKGVERIVLTNGQVAVYERGGAPGREITIRVPAAQ